MPSDRIPKHSPHSSGQGRIVLSGETHYTGAWGPDPEVPSPGCLAERDRVVSMWLANGRRPLRLGKAGGTVGGLCRRFAEWAEGRFRKRDMPTTYALSIVLTCELVEATHRDTPIRGFTPKSLRQLRLAWLVPPGHGRGQARRGRNRETVNKYAGIVVDMFRWGVEEEVVPPDVHAALKAVAPLKARDVDRPDPPPRLSAPRGSVEAAMEAIGGGPAPAILRLLDATGMRPGEACRMRLADLDRSGETWLYRVDPETNKAEHHGRRRVVFLGPRAQAILSPFVAAAERAGRAWVFTPSRGRYAGTGPYTVAALRVVSQGATRRRKADRFTPAQLRHTAASRLMRARGLEAARVTLGHADARTTLIYIDPDAATAEEREAARRAAMELG